MKLVLIRHGQSMYNLENKFTGWKEVDLSEKGLNEAREAGAILKKHGYIFDIAYTSVLKRARRTVCLVLQEMELACVPVDKSWRMNDRQYGARKGLNKAGTAKKYGEEQVHTWRMSMDVRPPELDKDDPRYEATGPRYKDLNEGDFPLTENLVDTEERVLTYWHDTVSPAIQSGQRVVIASHGNTIRSLVQYLDNVSDEDIMNLNIPTGIPLVYELDDDLKPITHYYLGWEGKKTSF